MSWHRHVKEQLQSIEEALKSIQQTQVHELPWLIYGGLVLLFIAFGLFLFIRDVKRDIREGLTAQQIVDKYPLGKRLRKKLARGDKLRHRDYYIAIFFSLDTFTYFFRIIGAHLVVFLVVGGVLLWIFASKHYDVAALSVLEIFFALIVAFYASRADLSAKQAHEVSQQSYEKANLAMSSIMNFSDDLAGFVERLQTTIQRLADERKELTIKFVSVIPAFGKVGLDEIIPGQVAYYSKMKEIQGSDYRTWHDFLINFLNNHNANKKTGRIYAKLKMLTHDGEELRQWIESIIKASRLLENTEHDLNQVIAQEVKKQQEYIRKMNSSVGDDYFKIKKWTSLGNGNNSIPFQFVIIKQYVERDDSNEPLYENGVSEPTGKLMFIFSGDYIYNNFLKSVEESLNGQADKQIDLSMKEFVRFTKGYYSEDIKVVRFFDQLFEVFWQRCAPILNAEDQSRTNGAKEKTTEPTCTEGAEVAAITESRAASNS